MARKRLIKGANAARVEERIARVPADVVDADAGPGASIFGALRALEAVAPLAALRTAEPAAPKARARRDRGTGPGRDAAAEPSRPTHAAPSAAPADAARAAARPSAQARIGPSDFNAAEREAIVRCCSDYRNRLPTYLLAVQKEVRVIDSVIEKCQATGKKPKKS